MPPASPFYAGYVDPLARARPRIPPLVSHYGHRYTATREAAATTGTDDSVHGRRLAARALAVPSCPSRSRSTIWGRWRECLDCGLFQRLPDLQSGEAAVCARCDTMLHRSSRDTLALARVEAVAAALLFAFMLFLPLGELHLFGRIGVSTVLSGPDMLRASGQSPLAVVVVATLVVVPAAKLAVQLAVLFGVRAQHPPQWLAWLFGWLRHISPWAMLEVYLLGSFVAYSRLQDLATVRVGPAALALGGATLALVAVDATLDPEAIWQRLRAGLPRSERRRGGEASASAAPALRPGGVIGCAECGVVVDASVGRCPCCRHALSERKDRSGEAWAMLLSAALLYIPANALPVMTVRRMARGEPTTIVHGVIELAENHLVPARGAGAGGERDHPRPQAGLPRHAARDDSPPLIVGPAGSTRLLRFVRFVGRWSMIDVFMLSVLVGVVRFGSLATVTPGPGAMAFCAVVLLTMVATELFDPRLMWDAAGRRERPVQGRQAPHATREELHHAPG